MLITIPDVLTADELRIARDLLARSGMGTWRQHRRHAGGAGEESLIKKPSTCRPAPTGFGALSRSATFFTAAPPLHIYPPLYQLPR